MEFFETMKQNIPYAAKFDKLTLEVQDKAKILCYKFNMSSPDEKDLRKQILKELFGTYNEKLLLEPQFRCDYGFNIHFHGFALVNYNCVILDTSPVNIGNNVLIAPGVCIACAGHAVHLEQRRTINTSRPISIEDGVWIGANATICGGVTIGAGSIIGAGSVVNRDIPAGVVAVGVPCKIIRKITDEDKLEFVGDEKIIQL